MSNKVKEGEQKVQKVKKEIGEGTKNKKQPPPPLKGKTDSVQSQEAVGSAKNLKKTGIPRNVNSYAHFLKHEYITEQDIEWVLKLRNTDDSLREKLAHIPNQPFTVYDKTIKSLENTHSVKDVTLAKGNMVNVEHLIRHRIGPTPTLGTVQFETGLRGYTGDEKFQSLEKGWSTIPKRERHEFPKFLPKLKDELQLRKTYKQTGKMGELYTDAFDRYLSLPKFSEKFRDRNVASNLHLCRPDAFTSTIQWETSLR